MMCEYEILIQDRLSRGQLVILTGRARGTRDLQAPHLPKCSWTVPAAWRALVRDGLVVEWRVLVNPEPIRLAVDDVGQRAD